MACAMIITTDRFRRASKFWLPPNFCPNAGSNMLRNRVRFCCGESASHCPACADVLKDWNPPLQVYNNENDKNLLAFSQNASPINARNCPWGKCARLCQTLTFASKEAMSNKALAEAASSSCRFAATWIIKRSLEVLTSDYTESCCYL